MAGHAPNRKTTNERGEVLDKGFGLRGGLLFLHGCCGDSLIVGYSMHFIVLIIDQQGIIVIKQVYFTEKIEKS